MPFANSSLLKKRLEVPRCLPSKVTKTKEKPKQNAKQSTKSYKYFKAIFNNHFVSLLSRSNEVKSVSHAA